jgi:quercetin 2,3-dioxygenase
MLHEAEAIIHLAEKRECFQTESFRSYLTDYQNDMKFSDNTLAPQGSYNFLANEKCTLFLLPLVGTIEIIGQSSNRLINAGELGYYSLNKNENIFIHNPYENELVNYIEIHLKSNYGADSEDFLAAFDLTKAPNSLIQIAKKERSCEVFIGKFEGRKEGLLSVNESEKVFVFVINGVFEVEDRLLETRTGLTLWNTQYIEFEALAVDNIILFLKHS